MGNIFAVLKHLLRKEEATMEIYYAHSVWKFGTQIEDYELDLIRAMFPGYHIINPAVDIPQCETEEEIMVHCVNAVQIADVLVFSSVDGIVGKGVYEEIVEAINAGKRLFYIWQDTIIPCNDRLQLELLDDITTNRMYAKVML
ncbi:MAG TPA: hypothetical protein PLT28_00105 [Saprospiraceae bacterium]|nr:hypothetical protein [Saprospiraceae bacterium]